ncbi:tRNA-dihydrouridine synthase [Candidatus Gottesmanbacteria bacterium]|nr:tRNA-dihydrouridine synthase [Candidatus Gottesmanbacteria bacterium]
MKNFWQKLEKPILALAPMEEVTDTVFRQIVASCCPPDVFFTEFTNVEGLLSKGKNVVSQRLQFTSKERPIIAQIWGLNPESYYKAARYIKDLGFDGIDINMGCPEKKVVKTGSCSALMNNRDLAVKIIKATREGAGGLPMSVKTRIGFAKIETDNWISFLLQQELDGLIIHGRTVKEASDVPAQWDEIGKAVILRNKISPATIIIGNGDVLTYNQARQYWQKYKVDGVMIGRGVFKNPWVFDKNKTSVTPLELIDLFIKHITLFENTWGDSKNFSIMKKFYKMYINGFEGAGELRNKLNQFNNPADSTTFLRRYATLIGPTPLGVGV